MGLGFSHGNAGWPYSGFNRFRTRLAAVIGIQLNRMEGFGPRSYELGRFPDTKETSWSTVDDPIVALLNHSDCDGELTVEECKTAAPRLRELVSFWPEDDHDRQHALLLADAMEDAASRNEPLGFR